MSLDFHDDFEGDEICLLASEENYISGENRARWSYHVRCTIDRIRTENELARVYIENYFYQFEKWPYYITEIFVMKNIANWSYKDRNKICIFFFGNGGTLDIMTNISHFYSPTVIRVMQKRYDIKYKKCTDLFMTYQRNLYNPAYAERYYYYSIEDKLMLYLDQTPRRNGQRVENNGCSLPRFNRMD